MQELSSIMTLQSHGMHGLTIVQDISYMETHGGLSRDPGVHGSALVRGAREKEGGLHVWKSMMEPHNSVCTLMIIPLSSDILAEEVPDSVHCFLDSIYAATSTRLYNGTVTGVLFVRKCKSERVW